MDSTAELMKCLAIIQTCFTGFLVLLTLFYVITTGRQLAAMKESLKETRRSNDATEKSNEIAERGLLSGRRARLLPEIGVSPLSEDQTRFTMLLVNSGGAPCIIGRVGVNSKLVLAFPEKLDFPEKMYRPEINGLRGSIVPPGRNNINVMAELPDNIAGWEETANILLVYCHIEYVDDFEKPWETVLCWCRERGLKRWFVAPQYSKMK